MSIHEQIVQAFNNYVAEQESFETKGVKAAAARARKALGDLGKLTKERRKEIQEKKNNMWSDMAMQGGQTFKDEKPNKKYKPYKGIGRLYHGRPVVFYATDDPEFQMWIHRRKERIRLGVISLFWISFAYIVGDIFYLQVYKEMVDKAVRYML